MKKNLKKIVALLVCALLLVSPTAALAEPGVELDVAETANVREINITKADIDTSGASAAIQKALNIARFDNEAGDEIKITVEPGEYNLKVALEMYSNTTLDVTDCTFTRSNPDKTYQYNMIRIGIASDADSTTGQLGYANKNIKIIGGTFDGDYRTGTVIKAGHTEDLEITGTTIKNGTNAHLMELAGVRNVVVKDCSFMNQLAVKGDKTLPEVCEEALQIDIPEVTHMANYRSEPLTSTDIIVDNCYFENSPRGVGSHTAILNSPFKRIQVTNCTFKKMTSVAIQTVSWEDSIITGNTITDSPRGIAMYSLLEDGLGTFTASYVAAQGNTTTTIPSTYKAPSKNMNVLIDDNDITLNSTKDSLADYVRLGISVAGNVVTDASHKKWGGVDYAPNGDYYISGVTVSNNRIHTTGHGIRLMDALNCIVKNNTIDCIATTGDSTSYYGIQCFCGSRGVYYNV